MLVTVVGVFLAVELPQAVTLILLLAQYTFSLQIFAPHTSAAVSLVCNLVILLSYPTNFFIYCAMSRAFRTTFAELFCCASRRRRSLDNRITMTAVPTAPIGKRNVKNADEPAMTEQFSDNAADSNLILTVVDGCREEACLELIEEQNETIETCF